MNINIYLIFIFVILNDIKNFKFLFTTHYESLNKEFFYFINQGCP